jgi:hypothetical protein
MLVVVLKTPEKARANLEEPSPVNPHELSELLNKHLSMMPLGE